MSTRRNQTIVLTSLTAVACSPGTRGDSPFGEAAGDGITVTADGDSGAAAGGEDNGATAGGSGPGGDDGNTSNDLEYDIGGAIDTDGAGEGGSSGEGCKYLDMLFVVDISGSMEEEKDNLNANFPDFVQVLDDYIANPEKGALGYRIGVTNSSFVRDGSSAGLDGALVDHNFGGSSDCGTGADPWLEGPAADMAENFTCLAQEPMGCTNVCSDQGKERPLDSIVAFADKHAAGGPNEGFYRGEASLLVIVTLTDEDDQSMVSPAGAKARLDEFAQGEERYVVVTVAGQENGGCVSAFGDAAPAPRLHQFTNSVPNGLMGDICQGDLTQALEAALELITFSCDTLPPPVG